jgi:hypothetical protein
VERVVYLMAYGSVAWSRTMFLAVVVVVVAAVAADLEAALA